METLGEAMIPELVRLRLGGKRQHEVATALGVSAGIVSRTLKQPEVQALIDEANRESYAHVADQLGTLALEALLFKAEVMRGMPDEAGVPTVPVAIRSAAASDIMDRCGVTKEATVKLTGGVAVAHFVLTGLSPEQAKALAWGEVEGPVVLDVQETENEAK
jgi:hypothetical protein